jgi:hypothetical protein
MPHVHRAEACDRATGGAPGDNVVYVQRRCRRGRFGDRHARDDDLASGVIPAASVGLILGVHVLLSSAFVPVNVLGNSLATIDIARMERAVDLPTLQAALQSGPEEALMAPALYDPRVPATTVVFLGERE